MEPMEFKDFNVFERLDGDPIRPAPSAPAEPHRPKYSKEVVCLAAWYGVSMPAASYIIKRRLAAKKHAGASWNNKLFSALVELDRRFAAPVDEINEVNMLTHWESAAVDLHRTLNTHRIDVNQYDGSFPESLRLEPGWMPDKSVSRSLKKYDLVSLKK